MKILITDKDRRQLKRIDQVPHGNEMRYYYIADEDAKFHLVSRIGPVELLNTPAVVEASVGWGEGWHGKCHPHHEGRKLSKVTLRRVVTGGHEKKLSTIIRESRNLPSEVYKTRRWKS